jgi:hypothetical protein
MKKIVLLFIFIILTSWIFAQEAAFKMEVSNDTVLMGNYFIVKYKISNIKGNFEAPDFSDFEIVGGPMSNSMYSMVNGKTTHESSYTYYLKPLKTGVSRLEKARLNIGDQVLYTESTNIIALENPEKIIENPKLEDSENDFFFNSEESIYDSSKVKKEDEKKKKLNIRKL